MRLPFFRFPVGRWLDADEGDKRISLELEPNKKPASKTGKFQQSNWNFDLIKNRISFACIRIRR